jgi:hypothetical protein
MQIALQRVLGLMPMNDPKLAAFIITGPDLTELAASSSSNE